MGYTNSRETIKWRYTHTNTLKYFSSAKFDEQNNKFGKVWSTGSSLMNGKNISAPTMLNIYP